LIAICAVAWGWTRTSGPANVNGASPTRLSKLEAELEAHRTLELEHLERIHALEAKEMQVGIDKEKGVSDSASALAKLEVADKNVKETASKLAKSKTELDKLQGEAKQARDAAKADVDRLEKYVKHLRDTLSFKETQDADARRAAATEIERLRKESKQYHDALAAKTDLKGGDEKQPAVRAIHEQNNSRRLIFNWPLGEYTVQRGTGGSKVRLSGTLKRLILQGLDGGSLLEATDDFHVEEIRFTGSVVGNSTVKIVAEKANVEMGRIDGRSTVTLRVLGGKVKVDEVVGDSKLLVWTKDFALKNYADGNGTGLNITLNRDGHLSFGELRGSSKLIVQKLDRGDPEMRIDAGKVGPKAVFKKI
jgi:hypothetical protein